MRAFLLYADRDLDVADEPAPTQAELDEDLELDVLLTAMARGDDFLYSVARAVLHERLSAPEQIRYRQDILSDCLRHPDIPRAIYNLAVETIQAEHQIWGSLFSSASSVLNRSMQVMALFAGSLRKLRAIADERAAEITSAGLTSLFDVLRSELGDGYLAEIEDCLSGLRFRNGMLLSARLDAANKGTGYVLRQLPAGRPGLRGLLSPASRSRGFTFTVPDRDINGHRTLSELRDRGIDLVADALSQSCAHILRFFNMLRQETGFYIGCLHAHEQLTGRQQPVCMPSPLPAGQRALRAAGLYDPCLALSSAGPVAGNDVTADGRALVMITGANQGGKSTFLRSIGLAHLMMQSGMFVAAASFTASVRTGIHTHYKRGEDVTMTRGKLDEELARMSEIVEVIRPGGLLLCNESFAATNEREGSHIARNIIGALLDCDVTVFVVTHFYDLAQGFCQDERNDALFLRAARDQDGRRSYQLAAGDPLVTAHASDIYQQIFGEALAAPHLPANTNAH